MFPGADTASLADASFGLIGAPLERSVSYLPGTRFGPDFIRRGARGFEDYDHRTDVSFRSCAVHDTGDLRPWQDAAAYLDFLTGELTDIVAADAVPLLLGGEHTVSVAGVRATTPTACLCFDAHLDLRSSFDDDPWSHATAMHHVLELVDELVVLGARAGSPEEWERVRTSSAITAVEPDAIDDWIDDSLPSFCSAHSPYVSLDIDAIDPSYAPATGTREPYGLEPTTVRRILESVAPVACGLDIVEVNDRDDGQTGTLAAKLLRDFVTHAWATS